jgi:hypothetical protein
VFDDLSARILPRQRTRQILPGLKTGPKLLVRFVWFYQSDFTRAEILSVLSDFTSRILPGLKTCLFCLSGLSDFTKAENSSNFTRAENWAEGVSDFGVWDIGQVTVSNFNWLPFTPPLVAFSGPSLIVYWCSWKIVVKYTCCHNVFVGFWNRLRIYLGNFLYTLYAVLVPFLLPFTVVLIMQRKYGLHHQLHMHICYLHGSLRYDHDNQIICFVLFYYLFKKLFLFICHRCKSYSLICFVLWLRFVAGPLFHTPFCSYTLTFSFHF